MSFFDSEIVQEEMKEISKLQDEIYAKVFSFSSMDADDKLEHVEMLENLLKKQNILYTRLSLSDDPEAKMMKENILKSAKQLGFPPDVDLGYVFSNMSAIIDTMKKSIREGP
jgi:GTPase Era involved in 16S rRNA processing